MHHDLMDFIPEMLIGLTPEYNAIHPTTKIKNKNHMIISLDTEKSIEKNPAPFPDGATQQTKTRREHFQSDKGCLLKNPYS